MISEKHVAEAVNKALSLAKSAAKLLDTKISLIDLLIKLTDEIKEVIINELKNINLSDLDVVESIKLNINIKSPRIEILDEAIRSSMIYRGEYNIPVITDSSKLDQITIEQVSIVGRKELNIAISYANPDYGKTEEDDEPFKDTVISLHDFIAMYLFFSVVYNDSLAEELTTALQKIIDALDREHKRIAEAIHKMQKMISIAKMMK